MKRHLLRTRLPMPWTDHGRDMAESIWKRRHELEIVPCQDNDGTSLHATVTPALVLYVKDSGDSQLITAKKTSHSDHGSNHVHSTTPGVHVDQTATLWIGHAMRAAQIARILAALGLGDDVPEGTTICHVDRWKHHKLERMMSIVAPRRPPTTAEFLEERLDAEIMRRLAGMPITSTSSYTMEIGNGVAIDSARFEPILGVSHPNHGTVTLPGLAAADLNRRTDELRLSMGRRLPSSAGPETARISRVLEICQEAVRLDPDMTDASGTPLLPLVESHLPRLALRIEDATRTSDAIERSALDAEIDEVLSCVASSVEEGMTIAAKGKRDALRQELRFLTSRHPGRNEMLENAT